MCVCFNIYFGLPTPSEVSLSRIVSPKKAVFRAFFLENHVFDPFRPNEDPQVLYMAGKLWISVLSIMVKPIHCNGDVEQNYDDYARDAEVAPFCLEIIGWAGKLPVAWFYNELPCYAAVSTCFHYVHPLWKGV